MYKEFFGLREPPFNLTPDPRFLYMSRRHREALASLVYGIKECKGFIVLTGEIGSGKTTLCRAFLKELNPDTTNVALILNSFLSDVELLQAVNDEFGIESAETSKKLLIDGLNRFLLRENNKGKTTILIIDEAQNLSTTVLEQIRMLSNLETETRKLIQIVLIGQPELSEILELPNMEQLNQRVMVRYHITSLSREEIYQYIRHRLHVAGAKINISLTPPALNRLYRATGGVPRKINLVCDRALLAAYVAGRFQIDAKIIASAEKEVKLPATRPFGLSRRPAGRFARALWTVLIFLTGALLTTGAIWVGIQKNWLPPDVLTFLTRAETGDKTDDPEPPNPGPSSPETQSPALPEPPLPDLESLAVLSGDRATTAGQWVYDERGVVRMSDPDLAKVASLLTVARLWMNTPIGLEFFRDHDKSQIARLNMPAILSRPLLDLRSFERNSDLRKWTELDLPLVLDLEEPSGRLSPTVVLTGMKGDLCTLADPRLGEVELGIPALEPLVRRITVLYCDPEDLASLAPGAQSEAVEGVRLFLVRRGFWTGAAGAAGVFSDEMVEALKRFQEHCGLERTGRLDGPTSAAVVAMRRAFRPKLKAPRK